MLAAVDVGGGRASKQVLDPGRALVGLLDGLEEDPAKLLDVVLLEGVDFIPLEGPEQAFSVAEGLVGLELDEELLELVGDGVFLLDPFGVVAALEWRLTCSCRRFV